MHNQTESNMVSYLDRTCWLSQWKFYYKVNEVQLRGKFSCGIKRVIIIVRNGFCKRGSRIKECRELSYSREETYTEDRPTQKSSVRTDDFFCGKGFVELSSEERKERAEKECWKLILLPTESKIMLLTCSRWTSEWLKLPKTKAVVGEDTGWYKRNWEKKNVPCASRLQQTRISLERQRPRERGCRRTRPVYPSFTNLREKRSKGEGEGGN